jgi:hypothetical protein
MKDIDEHFLNHFPIFLDPLLSVFAAQEHTTFLIFSRISLG